MTTRELLRKEVIILMAKMNTELIINSAHIHISNVNKCLKNSKSNIVADFIHITNNRIIIIINKLANVLDLSTIEKYLKNIKNVNSDSIEGSCLPKSKLYMKIIGLPYKTDQGVITPDYIEGVLKELHLFKDVMLASKPRVIKASPKSNIAVVLLLFVYLTYVSLYALFLFDIIFFPSGLISLHKIRLYISFCHTVSFMLQ